MIVLCGAYTGPKPLKDIGKGDFPECVPLNLRRRSAQWDGIVKGFGRSTLQAFKKLTSISAAAPAMGRLARLEGDKQGRIGKKTIRDCIEETRRELQASSADQL